ncbi:MAG TPA: hypothetical protein VKT24_01820, partial [Rhizomicrobium sp.]|nr:hypothetical protein [Rhizomicrobium sp.]
MTKIRGPSWPLFASLVACAILAAPLWWVATPPMPDFPAHLADFYLIGGGASHYYRVAWAFLPNLAGEAIVPPLAKLTNLEIATKIFLTVTVWLWVLGPAAIQHALFGRFGLGGILAAAFTYNATFMWGFFNFDFAMGLSFLVLAAWIATDGKRHLIYLAGFAAAFTLIYFAHLFALATLLLLIGSYEIAAGLQEKQPTRMIIKRLATLAILTAPAALFYFVLKPSGGDSTLQFNLIDTMTERFEAAIQFGFDRPAYIVTAALLALFIAAAATRRLRIAIRMGIALGALLACTIFAPEWALGGWGVHFRLPAILGSIALASSDFKLSRRGLATGVMAALGLFVIQAAVLAHDWSKTAARYSEFRAAEYNITPGARLLTVLDGDSLGFAADQPYWHIAEFSVIDRGAFTPLVFTTRGQHIVSVIPPFDRYAAASAQQGSPPDIDELNDLAAGRVDADEDIQDVFPYLLYFQCHFDEAIVIRGDGPASRVPPMLRLRYQASFFS